MVVRIASVLLLASLVAAPGGFAAPLSMSCACEAAEPVLVLPIDGNASLTIDPAYESAIATGNGSRLPLNSAAGPVGDQNASVANATIDVEGAGPDAELVDYINGRVASVQKMFDGGPHMEEGVTGGLADLLDDHESAPEANVTVDSEEEPLKLAVDNTGQDKDSHEGYATDFPAPEEPSADSELPAPVPFTPSPQNAGERDVGGAPQDAWVPVMIAVAAAAAAWAWYRLAPLLGAFFTRITQNAAARQSTRRMMLDLLQDRPGMTVEDLMDTTQMAEGTVRYHLRVLVHHALVESTNSGRRVHFFCASERQRGLKPREQALLLCPTNRRILDSVLGAPGIHQGAIAEQVQLSQSQVHERTRRLVEHDLLHRVRDGRRVVYHPAPRTVEAVQGGRTAPNWEESIQNPLAVVN